MAKKLQILRGTTAQNDAYTGSIGELTMDTEKVEVRIHDGTTQGGKTIGSGGDYVVESQLPNASNNYTWYRKYKSGWVEQGVAALISGGDAIVITLPVPMSSINYNISLSQYNSDTTAPNLNRLSFYNQTATGFSVISRYASSNAARNFMWQVCGQAA